MKVLYFHQHFSTPSGSTSIRSYEMARALVARGHEVVMICGRYDGGKSGLDGPFVKGKRQGIVDGIKVVEFDLAYSNNDNFIKRSKLFLLFAARSIALALTERYDLAFATTTPLTAGIPGIFARWLRSKPFIFEVRDLWPELPRAMGVIRNPIILGMMSLLEWLSYHSAQRLIGLSPGIVEGMVKRGVDRSLITMIPNGCDLKIFNGSSDGWRPPGVRDSDLMAVFAGTHGVANGLDSVLDAALVLKMRGREDIKLVLVGRGKLKPALQKRASSEGLDNVVFHDPVSKTRLAGLMASTDLGMQILGNHPAFYYGTSPNKFFDYLASGLPVLNNYPGWLADMIRENRCGYAVPPEDPEAFASALEDAADHPEEPLEMGKRGLDLARRQFDREVLANQFADWLEGATLRRAG
jgi:glycosyltransferase involved in cell wall biosynthesis